MPDGSAPYGRGRADRRAVRRRVWAQAAEAARIPTVHLHDLRHTGNNLTARAGAKLRELRERMGHGSTRAALIYLHATNERQRALADNLGVLIESTKAQQAPDQDPSGTDVARRRQDAAETTQPRSVDLG